VDTKLDYSKIVERVIKEYAFKPSHGEIEPELIIDRAQGHFELMFIGWDRDTRVHGSVIHIDIIGDKIWIQHDGTSAGVAQDLEIAGIPREDIILAFKPERVRPYTGYGVR
jgi:hypothetical protein